MEKNSHKMKMYTSYQRWDDFPLLCSLFFLVVFRTMTFSLPIPGEFMIQFDAYLFRWVETQPPTIGSMGLASLPTFYHKCRQTCRVNIPCMDPTRMSQEVCKGLVSKWVITPFYPIYK